MSQFTKIKVGELRPSQLLYTFGIGAIIDLPNMSVMGQFSLECGYSTASIRERIYSQDADEEIPPMAGILLYTAAPDSEWTMGGWSNWAKRNFSKNISNKLWRKFVSVRPIHSVLNTTPIKTHFLSMDNQVKVSMVAESYQTRKKEYSTAFLLCKNRARG